MTLLADRRAPPPRAARRRRAARRGPPGRDLLDGVPLPGKATGELRAGQRLRIETPGGGGFGDADAQPSGRADRLPRARDHGLADGGEPGPRRLPAGRLDAHARQGRGLGGRARRRPPARRPPRSPARSDVVISMVVDGEQVASVLLGEGGAIERRAGRAAVRGHVDDRAADRRGASARRWRERGVRMLDAPVTGSSPRAEDGTLTIMVGRRRGRTSRARCRCSRRWAS